MTKRGNPLDEMRVRNLTQYCGVVVFLLAVSYVLIITNPPSELLFRDNENIVHTKNLSMSEISEYGNHILVFTGLFSLLSCSIGLLTAIIMEADGRKGTQFILLLLSTFLVMGLCFIIRPYYGESLTFVMAIVGIPFYFMGLLYAPSFRVQRVYFLKLVLAISAFFALAAMVVFGLILRVLPPSVMVVLYLSGVYLFIYIFVSFLEKPIKGAQKRLRPKYRRVEKVVKGLIKSRRKKHGKKSKS